MKTSQYNIYIEGSKDHYFVYNTMKRAILIVDPELKQCLETNQIAQIDSPLIDPLKKCGIIVDDDTDELKLHRLNHNQVKYNTSRSSFLIFTTYSCNLQCPYCYEGPVVDPEYKSIFMKPEITSQVVEFICNQMLLNRSQKVGIGLYGGEPLLNVNCCETVVKQISEWCREYNIGFYTTITTNGTLLNEKTYERIGKYLSSIHITLDGPQRFHDKKRIKKDGSGTYSEILENLKLLKTTKEHLSIRISFDEENRHSMDELLEDLEEIGLKGRPYFHIYFAQITPQNICLTFPEDPRYRQEMKESIQYTASLVKMAQERGWADHLAVNIGQEHSLVPINIISCDYVKHGMYSIDPVGDIYMCPASAGDTQYRIGKIQNGAVKWNTSYYNIITRDPSRIDTCKQCELLPACGGGCAIASYLKYKDYYTAFCGFNRDLIYERIKKHLKFKYPEKFEK